MPNAKGSPTAVPDHHALMALEASRRGDLPAASAALMSSFALDDPHQRWKTRFLVPIDHALKYRELGGDPRALEDFAIELFTRQASRAIPGLERKDAATSWWLVGVQHLALALLWESAGADRARFPEIVAKRLPAFDCNGRAFQNAMTGAFDPANLFRGLQGER